MMYFSFLDFWEFHNICVMELKHELLTGKRTDSTLLYIPSEKNLYVKNSSMKGVHRYVCYQKILRKPDQNINATPACYARITMKGGKCFRTNEPHASHDDHQHIYEDLLTSNKIKSTCKQLREILGESARAVETRTIFNRELAK